MNNKQRHVEYGKRHFININRMMNDKIMEPHVKVMPLGGGFQIYISTNYVCEFVKCVNASL